MADQPGKRHSAAPVIAWLLEGDPAVRWQVLRDLTGAPAAEVAAERARVAAEGWGARLLALQEPGGTWGGAAWNRGWDSTMHALMLLRDFGLDPAGAAARRALEHVRAGVTWKGSGPPECDDNPFFAGELEPCINGQVGAAGAYFGQDIGGIIDRLLGEQLADGGWNCEAENGSTRSSFNTTICVLEALLAYEQAEESGPNRSSGEGGEDAARGNVAGRDAGSEDAARSNVAGRDAGGEDAARGYVAGRDARGEDAARSNVAGRDAGGEGAARGRGGQLARVTQARLRGQEYLLERRLFRRRSTGAVIEQDRKGGAAWTRFAFPTWWHYDVLRGLEYLRQAGGPPDERAAEAVALVESKRGLDGRWLLETRYPGRMPVELGEEVGRPSRWITLRALRVLDWWGSSGR